MLNKRKGKNKLRGYASDVYDDCFYACGLPLTRYYGGGGGKSGGSSEQDTRMDRHGTSQVISKRVLPSSLSSLVSGMTGNVSGPSQDGQLALGQLLRRDSANPGYDSMSNAANVDPFSSSYESATQGQFDKRVRDALAQARSGEENVLAPVSRGSAIRESETIRNMVADRGQELRQERNTDAGISREATQGIAGNTINAAKVQSESSNITADNVLKLADLIGSKVGTTVEDLKGKGAQTASSQAYSAEAGSMCCWILLESYRGTMPTWVRECRNEFAPESTARRLGYRRMANWLVPLMKKSLLARGLVYALMVKPLELWGGYHKKLKGYKQYAVLYPVVKFWFTFWSLTGKKGVK